MNAIQLKLIKSALDTVKNDYTAIVVASGTVGVEELYENAAKNEPNLSGISIELAFNTWMRHIGEKLGEGMFVNFGGIGLMASVEGSMLHVDDEISSDRLGVQVTMFNNSFTEAISKLKVSSSVDESTLPFVLTKIEDESSNKLNVVTPGGKLKLIGEKLSYGLEGESCTITDVSGKTEELTNIASSADGNWLEAIAPDELEPGKGVITVLCRGAKTPEGALWKDTKTVTILKRETPPELKIAKVYSAHLAAEDKANLFADDVDITMNQPLPEGSTATIELVNKETGAVRSSLKIEDSTKLTKMDEKTLRLHFATNTSNAPDGTWELTDNYDYRIAVTTPEGTFYRAITPVISWLR